MSVSDEQITKLFKARRTVLQMLRDREYSVPDSDVNMTRQQFIEKFGENIHLKRDDLLILSKKGDAPTDQIYVFFPAEQKVGVPMVRNCAKRMKADNVYNAILVVQRALTAPAKAAIVEINSYFHMEVFEEAELLTNITEHMFVPKHTVLKDKEKKELLEKYRVKETQLPRILVSDPVAKYYGMRRGQVVKITRQSVTADTYDTYRYAVDTDVHDGNGVEEAEDMEERPKPGIWTGDEYEPDPKDDEKPLHIFSHSDRDRLSFLSKPGEGKCLRLNSILSRQPPGASC